MIYYEMDGDTIKKVLRLSEYGGEDEGSWVPLLEPLTAGSGETGPSGADLETDA